MKKTLKIFAFAVIALAALASCAKDQFKENVIPAGEKIQVSINGQIGEFTSADATKATAESVVRVTWGSGDKVFVYDGSTDCIGTLDVTPDEKNASYALLSGTITTSAASPSKLTLVYVKGATQAPDIAGGKISIPLSAQNQTDVPFVLYSTIDYDADKLEKSNECIPFSFATSVMTVNCTGLPTGAITKAEIDGVSTACELTVTGSGVTVAGASKGTITRTETTAPSVFTRSDSRGSFILALAADPDAPTARNILVYQDSKVYGAPFTSTTLAGNKSYNTVYQLGEYVVPPAGILPGEFTVNSDGKKVHFSKGNLQATYNSGTEKYTWGFAENQYDFIGNGAGNTTINAQTDGAVVDLFCWSTEKTNYGIITSKNLSDFSGEFVDWGETIDNVGTWYTLSIEEWNHLFNVRASSSVSSTNNAHYAKATVNEIAGVILLPDIYEHPSGVTNLKNINSGNSAFSDNDYGVTDWEAMESAGAIFLPVAGEREGVSYYSGYGYCWSSTPNSNDKQARYVRFQSDKVYALDNGERYMGESVRLVTDASDGYAPAVKVEGVSLASKDTVEVGATKTLVATVTPANATHKEVTWSSSDKSVATVDATTGEVTGVAAGSAVITATTASGNFTATCIVTVAGPNIPEGALSGKFTVNAGGRKVHFSQGNLYYDGSKFNFEANQYDVQNSWSPSHVSHFFWSKTASVAYAQSYSESGTSGSDVFFTNAEAETAESNFTVNEVTGKYRTLSQNEWTYLFNTRSNASILYNCGVTVCGKTNCVVLLPDNWTWNESTVGTGWQTGGYPETSTEGFPVTWQKMQAAGAVCLPAAGFRRNSGVDPEDGDGHYWSSSADDEDDAFRVCFYSYDVSHDDIDSRYFGYSVRLVTEVE